MLSKKNSKKTIERKKNFKMDENSFHQKIQENFPQQGQIRLNAFDAQNSDLSFCVYSALSMISIYDWKVEAQFKKFKSLKAQAQAGRAEKKIIFTASDGFKRAPKEVLTGLALSLVCSLFRKSIDNDYLRQYREFMKRKSTFELNNELRKTRASKRKNEGEGVFFDLKALLLKVASENAIFFPTGVPSIAWSRTKSRRRLGFYDEGLNQVVVSRLFDDEKTPQFVVEYVIFHELLHAKHGALYERGESMQCRVHHGEFKRDEKSYPQFREAEDWIEKKLRYL